MPAREGTNWEKLVSGEELDAVARIRSKEKVEKKIKISDADEYIEKGWEVVKKQKKQYVVAHDKKTGDAFEDELWTVFYRMGFTTLNEDSKFYINYSDSETLTKQIDILAVDDETVLVVECKEAQREGTHGNFQQDINEIGYIKEKVFTELRKKFPKRKAKYIFAYKNYILGDQDRRRLDEEHIAIFDYSTVLYYKALVQHLGKAARYQLLGTLFHGDKIVGMNNCVPAIKGKMGGITYYSFLIEPARLLKIGYILHRTNANNNYEDLLPSYQRLIKKDRLKKVTDFVNAGGYFPNSIIVSVDTGKKASLTYQEVGKDAKTDSDAKLVMLNLPQTYQSVYIIDGQHRLYGYAGSDYANKDTIPVVAFENLDKEQQLKLFMEINVNQKAVPKSLKNILEIDLYDDSPDLSKRRNALLGRIAKQLGEHNKSPLFGRVNIGEDAKTDICSITLESIKRALDKTRFFSKYKTAQKTVQEIEKGRFQKYEGNTIKSDNDKTMQFFFPFLIKYLDYVKKNCEDEWFDKNGFLVTNNSIMALIRLLDDIISVATGSTDSQIKNSDELYNQCLPFFDMLCLVINSMSNEKKRVIKDTKGSSAIEKPYRTLQIEMYENDPDFRNDDIETYYNEHCVNYNTDAQRECVVIRDKIITYLKSIFSEPDWTSKHLSVEHEKKLSNRINNKQIENKRNGITIEVDIWQELQFADIEEIIKNGANWTLFFKEYFKNEGVDENKTEMISRMKSLGDIVSKINNGTHISQTQYAHTVHDFYIEFAGDDQ